MGSGQPCSPVFNEGVSGETTAAMLTRIGDITALSPDVVTVLGGTNDTYRGAGAGGTVSVATTTANLAAIYDALETAGAKIIACTLPPRDSLEGNNPDGAANLLEVNAWIRSNYSSWTDCYLCDFNPAMTDTGEIGSNPNDALLADGVHPNAAGGGVMANVLAPVLRSIFGAD